MMTKTSWIQFNDRGTECRIRATYGFHNTGNREAHFSITGEVEEEQGKRWELLACGCLHADIVHHFPALTPLIKWHLCFNKEGPMHYLSSGVYHWQRILMRVPDSSKHFASTVVLGALEGDELQVMESDNGVAVSFRSGRTVEIDTTVESTSEERLREVLVQRLPLLLKAMAVDMRAAGVDMP